jgi:molybdopterin-guanine dinucleotide biosynthesis protein A
LITLRKNCDAVVLIVNGRPQGFHAIYHKACLPRMYPLMQQGRLKISGFLQEIDVRYVAEPELCRFDPDLNSFVNVNTPDDLRRAEEQQTT